MNSMVAMLSDRRLHRLGGAKRLESDRIPKDTLYGELTEGKRKAGRPLLRSEDTCKRDLKQCCIDIDTWEKQTNDRPACLVPDREPGRESRRGEQEGNGSPEKTEEKRGEEPDIPAILPCLHEVQQRMQIAGRPLAQLSTTVMLYHRLPQTDGCRRRHLRNRKHSPCFFRVIEIRVEVWENEKCCGNTSRRQFFHNQ